MPVTNDGAPSSVHRPGGTVLAFGVPDEPTYEFPYKAWFRKNLTMIASVIPDPQLDFPEAVRMVEEGVFDSAPLYTHTFGLAEIQVGLACVLALHRRSSSSYQVH